MSNDKRVLLNGNPDSKKESYQWAILEEGQKSVVLTDYNRFTKAETRIILSKESLEKMLKLYEEE